MSSLAGAAAGGLCGAALLGIPTYLSNANGFLGPERKLAWLAASLGFVFGIVPGLVIGLVLGLLRPHPFGGVLIGIFVGFLILLVLLVLGMNPRMDRQLFSIGAACLPIGGVIGLVIALVNYPRSPAPDESVDRNEGRIFKT